MLQTLTWRSAFLIALFSITCLAFGPCGRVPGTRLSGEEITQPVTDWSFADQLPGCQIEVRPSEPYSINAACFTYAGRLFVGCMRCSGKRWPTYVAADPNVRVKLGDRLYPLRANRVTDMTTIQAAWDERSRKHTTGAATAVPADYWLFGLDPR